MDLENDELGARINQHGKIALCRSFNVKHNFPHFRKLLYVFTSRIYWWTIFRHFSGRAETVLLTRGFGYATAALPAALLWLAVTALVATPPASF